ncbi:hypothetical protein F5Y12DRAFT_625322 [Xylaria sp. FL1777]|nr:hypothetical protein F5Y12DRAFT_625322 [Xylaria sp. FL1777]
MRVDYISSIVLVKLKTSLYPSSLLHFNISTRQSVGHVKEAYSSNMRFNTVSLLLIAASAAHGGVVIKDVSDYILDVTQWQAGLSHGNPAEPTTSWYTFTVSGSVYGSLASDSYIPAFGAVCSGSGAGFPLSSDYSECAIDSETSESDSSVSARIVPGADNTQAHIAISYVFLSVNYTAIAVTDWARERPPYNFTLIPTSDAVAS